MHRVCRLYNRGILISQRRFLMKTTVVIDAVKASELPKAWRRRVKANAGELVTVTIARRNGSRGAKRKPNSTFGMWADRKDLTNPGAYVRALRRPRPASR